MSTEAELKWQESPLYKARQRFNRTCVFCGHPASLFGNWDEEIGFMDGYMVECHSCYVRVHHDDADKLVELHNGLNARLTSDVTSQDPCRRVVA